MKVKINSKITQWQLRNSSLSDEIFPDDLIIVGHNPLEAFIEWLKEKQIDQKFTAFYFDYSISIEKKVIHVYRKGAIFDRFEAEYHFKTK